MILIMALQLTHVVDEHTSPDGLRQLALLLDRLPAEKVRQSIVTIGRRPIGLSRPAHVPVTPLGRRFGWPLLSVRDLKRLLSRRHVDVLHAWSAPAAAVAGMAWDRGGRLSATLSDPAEAATASRWWQSTQQPHWLAQLFVVSPAKITQRRLVEAGIPIESTTIIRPGVDFAAIRRAKEVHRRASLGIEPDARVFATPSPPSRAGGHFLAIWAMAILHQVWPTAKLLISGHSREMDRLLRLHKQIYCPGAILPADGLSMAEQLALSDMVVAPATNDIAVGWLASAMAAGVPIVGTAIPSIAELIADRHNGFLCRPGEVHSLAIRIKSAWENPVVLRQCADTARGQAYDVFRAEASLQQYTRLFNNLTEARPPAEGVQDTATSA